MQPTHLLMIAATTLVLSSTSVLADTTITFDPFLMRECPQADGSRPLHQQGSAGLQADDAERTVGRALAGRHADLSPHRGHGSSL